MKIGRALSVDSAKDTYYGTVFSGIAVIVTIPVVFVGFNVYASTRESNRRLRELSTQSQATLQNQRNAFEEAFRIQTQKFNDLEVKAKEFQDANQKNIDNYLKLIKEKIDSVETNGTTADKSKIEEIERDMQRIKEVNSVKNNPGKGEVELISVDIAGNPF